MNTRTLLGLVCLINLYAGLTAYGETSTQTPAPIYQKGRHSEAMLSNIHDFEKAEQFMKKSNTEIRKKGRELRALADKKEAELRTGAHGYSREGNMPHGWTEWDLIGTATYKGSIFGEAFQGDSGSVNFSANMELTARFGTASEKGTIRGTISKFQIIANNTTQLDTLQDLKEMLPLLLSTTWNLDEADLPGGGIVFLTSLGHSVSVIDAHGNAEHSPVYVSLMGDFGNLDMHNIPWQIKGTFRASYDPLDLSGTWHGLVEECSCKECACSR